MMAWSLGWKVALGCSVLVLPSVAIATEWQSVPSSPTEIDLKSMEVHASGVRRVWQRYTLDPEVVTKLSADLKAIGQNVDFMKYSYTIALWEYDCRGKRLGALEGTEYSSNGRPINSWELKAPLYQRVIPDSDGATTFAFVCGARLQQKRGK